MNGRFGRTKLAIALGGRDLRVLPRRFEMRLAICTLLLLILAGTGCALGYDGEAAKPLVKECVIPDDQKSTINGHWKVTPVPLAFHQGSNWAPDEIADMVKAAETWNDFYTATQGIKVLDYGKDASNVRMSSQAVPTSACAQGLIQGNAFTGQVVIYKQGKWPHPSGAQSTIALTSFCTTPGKPYPSTYMAYMEVNYQYFFTAGHKIPDLQTIVAHELGHLLGLNHSCESNSTKTGMPDCMKPSLSADYRSALMFPFFAFYADLSGEQKRDLASNDQGRANCLYQKTTSTSK